MWRCYRYGSMIRLSLQLIVFCRCEPIPIVGWIDVTTGEKSRGHTKEAFLLTPSFLGAEDNFIESRISTNSCMFIRTNFSESRVKNLGVTD